MGPDHLILVVDDDRLAEGIRGSLKAVPGRAAPRYRFDSVRRHLGPDAAALLVLAAAAPADAAELVRLVQEVRLRDWPVTALVVAGAGAGPDLARLDPYVARRCAWPGEAGALLDFLRDHAPPGGRPAAAGAAESPDEWLARALRRQTPSLAPLAERLAVAAAHDVTVLLTGETGTGKTYLARLIHEQSPRKDQPLLVVPCGALAANLIESELFGHAKGAFTGADRAKVGKFEAVGGGTLLLDEIDALGLEQQAKLLRVIETGAYEPVGSNETKHCRARVIAASNWDLEEATARGKFRQDLYYRLNVLAFHLPPLRERRQDVGPLARGMVVRFSQKFEKGLFAVSPEALAALESFPWPGNIRQLENAVQQGVLVSAGPELLRQHLPEPVRGFAAPPEGPPPVAGSLAEHREQQERRSIERALAESNHCRSRAASALGISRVTLYNKLKKYGLHDNPRRWAGLSGQTGADPAPPPPP
jgi:DNA-binding NtrC family response regulator